MKGYEAIVNSVQNWLRKKENFDENKNRVFGINPKFYLWVFAILFIYIFFIRANSAMQNEDIRSMPLARDYILYEKPDNKSKVILQESASIEVKILSETKYYYKVEIVKHGHQYIGYINKQKIVH